MRQRLASRLRSTSVHAILTIALACTLSLVVGGFGCLLIARDRDHRLAELDARTGRLTDLLSRALSNPVWNVDALSIRTLLESLLPNTEVVSVTVDADNSISVKTPMRGKVGDDGDAFIRKRAIEYQENDHSKPRHIGDLTIVFTRQPVSQAVLETRNASLMMLVLLLASLCTVSYLLIRRIVLDPIQRLARAMDSFAAGAVSTRCHSDSQDELGQLSGRFNAMADRLVESNGILLGRYDELEVLVRERTRELGEARDRAESASRAKSSFLANMSHELRTPLNAVIGFSQLIQADAGDHLVPRDKARLDHIHRAGGHLLTLINDVLDVASIESGHVEVKLCAVDVGVLLDEAMHLNSHLARQSGIVLDAVHRDGPPIGVTADPLRLRQVIINLLSNAIKYNRAGGSVRSHLSRIDGGRIAIDVVDTGLGMTADQVQHLYEPFNRLGRERGGIDGSGIGLALTRQLVRLMHGTIDITSEVGRGTKVRVVLPAAELEERAISTKDIAPHDVDGAPTGVVLYIEDNPVNSILVEQMLARWSGVQLEHAIDGASGIERARALQPELILLDMQLPDMSGAEVLRLLREDATTRELRVIALSASAMPDEIDLAREAGALDYWTKPLDVHRFLASMSSVLARSALPLNSTST